MYIRRVPYFEPRHREVFSFYKDMLFFIFFYYEILSFSEISLLVFPYQSQPKFLGFCHLDFSRFCGFTIKDISFSIKKREFCEWGFIRWFQMINLGNYPPVVVVRIRIHVRPIGGFDLIHKHVYYFTSPVPHPPRNPI